jgi:hypothetical protein
MTLSVINLNPLPMYIIYTRHKVRDYDTWKKAFDENSPMLEEAGVTDWSIVKVNNDPTDVAIIVRSPSKKEWETFLRLDEEKMKRTGADPREKGGLIGEPEWWVGEEE